LVGWAQTTCCLGPRRDKRDLFGSAASFKHLLLLRNTDNELSVPPKTPIVALDPISQPKRRVILAEQSRRDLELHDLVGPLRRCGTRGTSLQVPGPRDTARSSPRPPKHLHAAVGGIPGGVRSKELGLRYPACRASASRSFVFRIGIAGQCFGFLRPAPPSGVGCRRGPSRSSRCVSCTRLMLCRSTCHAECASSRKTAPRAKHVLQSRPDRPAATLKRPETSVPNRNPKAVPLFAQQVGGEKLGDPSSETWPVLAVNMPGLACRFFGLERGAFGIDDERAPSGGPCRSCLQDSRSKPRASANAAVRDQILHAV